jgi:hypothetical protein
VAWSFVEEDVSTPLPALGLSKLSGFLRLETAPFNETCPLLKGDEYDEAANVDSVTSLPLLAAQLSDLPPLPLRGMSKFLLPYGTPRKGTCPLLNGEEYDESGGVLSP